ncbi:MAG: alpha/beta hydrolase [Ilumatobacteraceae bacterium]
MRITRSDQIEQKPPRSTTTEPGTTDPTSPSTTSPTATGDDLPAIDAVAWGPCDAAPDPWQCGSIMVPMDYLRPTGEQIAVALNRLPATDDSQRIGSLVLNPGGPGGSGLAIAFNEGDSFPDEIRARFDIVGFDPRGVGASTAVRCPDGFDVAVESDLQPCIDLTGELLAYLGTPNVARDLEMVRKALGDEQLTYLGFSYGTALGAVYADMFPDRVRAMVLDGAIDPDAGQSNVSGGGYDFYAQQDFEGTVDIFHTLCDATTECAAGPHSATLTERVYDTVRDTPAPYFAGGTDLRRSDVEDVIYGSMYSASNWPVLAIALRDADDGDASTIAAMASWLQFGYPADMESEANFAIANIAIRCADFASRGSGSYECEQFPESAEPLPVISTIDASNPIVVVGTNGDPATPGRYADQLADALGDAVDIEWEGAGHTAFLSSICITDTVTAYIVDQVVPTDGETCAFVVGAATVAERADRIFEPIERGRAIDGITPLLAGQGVPAAQVDCVAAALVDNADERLIVHELLGVESPDLVTLRKRLIANC